MRTLKFINDDNETVASINIEDTAFDQITTEVPILRFNDGTYTYSDANEYWVEYTITREFTVNVDDNRTGTVFETADPSNVL